MDYSEQRDFHRMTLDCVMDYQLEKNGQASQGKVINLSATGILFVTSDALEVGAKVQIKLTPVHDITPPMSADALVARCDKQSEDEYQVAAQIVQIH